jgi:hypothetical protein
VAVAAVTALGAAGSLSANEYAPQLQRFLEQRVRPMLEDPVVIDSIRAQNVAHAGLTQAEIDALDQQ